MGLRLQRSLVELRKAGEIGDVLLLLEHTPVITLGRNARRENLLASPELLAQEGVELFECDRGGDITFHGPGQLVGYPIIGLRGFHPRLGAVEFVRRLEEALIRTCGDFGVACEPVKGLTGAWTSGSGRKIAAIGVHISRGITSHGFALNVNTDLRYFKLIIPCGIASKPVTSIAQEKGTPVPLEEVAASVAQHTGEVFATGIEWVDTLDALLGHKVGVPMEPPAELRKLRGGEEIFPA